MLSLSWNTDFVTTREMAYLAAGSDYEWVICRSHLVHDANVARTELPNDVGCSDSLGYFSMSVYFDYAHLQKVGGCGQF
jgi:hypothetical protein